MVDQLLELVERVRQQPEAVQRHIAELIEQALKQAQVGEGLSSYAGAWSDLPEDDEAETLDQIRQSSPPTPPMDEQLRWLDEE